MKIIRTGIPDVLVIEPQIFQDDRGYFFESFHQGRFDQAIGRPIRFVQDNQSRSRRGVLRGLHYQIDRPQGKLIRVCDGEVFSVAVDLRLNSATFGKWTGVLLSSQNFHQLWLPEGFAHGFYVLSMWANLQYKSTEFWYAEGERIIRWDDADLSIRWPLVGKPILSSKDSFGGSFRTAIKYNFP
ncbi:dTDP-4-dehydrorhamnose 3,5-epimerase [Ralstonia mannitolilytica]|uniref:dTDP-4-dehydrorhamnose 3,5-epimerase n=1 Tax=Ralstonia mannitolilytica TaxID=105219 RepID=UPI0009E1ECC4|nr:dTDP-4-dehydrorhamnose 3,5-epimerase [Ralstonia mannitolilytica]